MLGTNERSQKKVPERQTEVMIREAYTRMTETHQINLCSEGVGEMGPFQTKTDVEG